MRDDFHIECLFCKQVITNPISMNESVRLMRIHLKEKHPEKPRI